MFSTLEIYFCGNRSCRYRFYGNIVLVSGGWGGYEQDALLETTAARGYVVVICLVFAGKLAHHFFIFSPGTVLSPMHVIRGKRCSLLEYFRDFVVGRGRVYWGRLVFRSV